MRSRILAQIWSKNKIFVKVGKSEKFLLKGKFFTFNLISKIHFISGHDKTFPNFDDVIEGQLQV